MGLSALINRVYQTIFGIVVVLMERGLLPDFIIRMGIRALLAKRLVETSASAEDYHAKLQAFVDELKGMPVAVQTAAANEQHYEVPTEYFLLCLGKRLKYSSCLYPAASSTLEEAEEAMLRLYCERAQLKDGQTVLELGCGWGSLCLYLAERYPRSEITAVSNSKTQKDLIMQRAQDRRLTNLKVITADVVEFDAPAAAFDRVMSIEMFEHMKNYKVLMARISQWLKPEGLLFVHIFVSNSLPYHYEVQNEDDWMARYFFTGGTMPSQDLLLHFQDDLAIQQQWYLNGKHYSRTLEDWLQRMDAHKREIIPLFRDTYGQRDTVKWWVRWRVFYLACSELFAFKGGSQWGVGHYVFQKRKAAPRK